MHGISNKAEQSHMTAEYVGCIKGEQCWKLRAAAAVCPERNAWHSRRMGEKREKDASNGWIQARYWLRDFNCDIYRIIYISYLTSACRALLSEDIAR